MRPHDLLRAWRWLFNVECSEPFCNARRRCWRWHVETLTCPTCKREVTEYDPAALSVIDAVFGTPLIGESEPRTWATGTSSTIRITHRSWL